MLMMHDITKNTSSEAHNRLITRLLAAAALGMVLASMITACNTVEGVGKDTSAVGDSVSDAARDAKN